MTSAHHTRHPSGRWKELRRLFIFNKPAEDYPTGVTGDPVILALLGSAGLAAHF